MSDSRYLSARLLQGFGVLLLVASFAYWALYGKQSELFVSAAMALIGLGGYQGIRLSVQIARDETPPGPKP